VPEFTDYMAGTPSWIDLGSPDVAVSTAFYGKLFGWKAEDQGEQAGHYTMFSLRGKHVGAVSPLQPGQPPAWTTYVSVDDADVTVKAARDAGATVLLEPMDVMTAGRMAVLMDPAGAVISIWQPRDHLGAQLANEPGSFCWNELASRDIDTAKRFYDAVFGWEGETSAYAGGTYTEFKRDGRTIGGMMEMGADWPAEVPPHWTVYFAVEDCDQSASRAQELGGSIAMQPTTIPAGRFATLVDPQGARFSVIALSGADAV